MSHQPLHERPVPVNPNLSHRQRLGLLDRAGLSITRAVGTMVAAILFTILAFISLPAAIASHNALVIVAWIAQTFLQLVLLPIIMVGQNIQGKHAEVTADESFKTTQTSYKDLEYLISLNQQQSELLEKLADSKSKPVS